MNQTLQAELDKLCKEAAAKHATTEKLINLFIQVQLAVAKLGVISTFSTSKHINVQESVSMLITDITNMNIIGGALAGIEDSKRLMDIYMDVHAKVQPLLVTYYSPAAGQEAATKGGKVLLS